MDYLKLFDFDADYQAFIKGEEFVTPNVSYILDTKIVYYNSDNIIPSEPNYAERYLTFTALEDSTIVLKDWVNPTPIVNLQYSKNNGEWITWNFSEIHLSTGDTLKFKGNNPNYFYCDSDDIVSNPYFGDSTGKVDVSGNIMSLLYGDNFQNKTEIPCEGCFDSLFTNQDFTVYLVNAKDLILPATALMPYCYYQMFAGCTSLITVPELPATTLAEGCYQYMFVCCFSLTTAPALPATILAEYCYQNMFNGCTSLNYIKMLATNISATECMTMWTGMFDDDGNEVSAVSPTGTFVKSAGVEIPNGTGGIPDGWVVETYIPNHIMNGWNELYPNVEELNIVNNSDTDVIIVFTNGDESFDLNAHTKIDMTFDKFINSRFNYEFIFDALYLNTNNNTKCVIKDVVYRSDNYNIGYLLEEYMSKYNIPYTEVFSIVIKNVANTNILPNGWTYLYENVKPFTIVNKTNGVLYLMNGNDYIDIYPDEAYPINNLSIKSNGNIRVDILLSSNNNENIVILSEDWNYDETLSDIVERLVNNYGFNINDVKDYSLVIYKTQAPE